MRAVIASLGLLTAFYPTAAISMGPGKSSLNMAQQSVMTYFNQPSQSRRVEITAGGRVVTICTDDCERFEIGSRADPAALWDGIVLFKSFISHTLIDDAFLEKNSALAKDVLQAHAGANCANTNRPESIASCALKKMAAQSGLKMTRIVYDEGNKCESTWSFDEPQKLIGKNCSRIKQN